MGRDARWASSHPARLGNRALEIWRHNEHLPTQERLERLAGDAELFEGLRKAGFRGEEWDFFANELARYGLAVIGGWIRRGLMKARCAEKRIQVPSLPPSAQQDDSVVLAIAGETVALALDRFRDDVLIPGVWDPAKGASLRTFFIGQCLRRYGNVVQRWNNHELPQAGYDDPDDELALIQNNHRIRGVEDDAIQSVIAQALLHGASSQRAARALAMDACGYTNAEIADDLSTTHDSISGLLKRERARLRQLNLGKGTA
jgi:hypothetical protein